MANRIQQDPAADPEQDIFGFVREGIDHAGLLALRVPRPTLIGSAMLDFFPIEGARESFAEARRLYEVAGAAERIAMAEAPGRHGLSAPLRTAVYAWFARWLAGRQDPAPAPEVADRPRADAEMLVCRDGQVNLSLKSRPFLPMAWEEFERKPRPARAALEDLLRLDPEQADPRVDEISPVQPGQSLLVCINGNESRDWREEGGFLQAVQAQGPAILVVDPRGVGRNRPVPFARSPRYADPLDGVEENIAYNAFLVGKSLLGMRVADVLSCIARFQQSDKPRRIVVCGRRDAGLVACLAAAISEQIDRVACEDILLCFRTLFTAEGHPFNAASILPGLLQRFGDVADVMARIAPRRVLIAAGTGGLSSPGQHVRLIPQRFSNEPEPLIDWLSD
jgi:hypothetical protein